MAQYVKVALPVPLRRSYDYQLDSETPAPPVGSRVRVPFGQRQVVGVVLAQTKATAVPANKIKAVSQVLDHHSLWPEPLWQLLLWAARYYHHPVGEVLSQSIPVLLRQGEPAAYRAVQRYQPTAAGMTCDLSELARAPRQAQALAALRRAPLTRAETRAEELSSQALRALTDKGLAEITTEQPGPRQWAFRQAEPGHQLNEEQALAVAAVETGRLQAPDRVWLLEGVTGSGKTEVYLQVMAPILAAGQQVMVLVPEIGLTPQTVARFRARFAVPVVVLHSGLTEAERLQAWLEARDGGAAIVIGTRSAVFTPMARPGLMIIDEEHDSSFKQQDSFRYNARDLAIKRSQLEQFPVLLGSATPSLESLANVQRGNYHQLQLTRRAGLARQAEHQLIDLREQRLQQGFSDGLLSIMRQHLGQGRQVLVFLNRRGYAPALLCHECGWVAECNRCERPLTWHQSQHNLQCHHCGHIEPVPHQCGDCGSTQLLGRGQGTEQVEEVLAQHFPEYPVLRIDRDSTRRKGELHTRLEQATRGDYPILLGTQMLAKGHHFPRVTLAALLDVDGALFSSDFRAAERLAQLYTQVAGRAGRAEHAGRVVLQTHQPEHPLLQELVNNGYQHFAQAALAERAAALMPPFAALAIIRAEATDSAAAEQLLLEMVPYLEAHPEVMVLGPMPAPMPRRAGRYRFQLWLHSEQRKALHSLLQQRLSYLEQVPGARKARWSLDIDPLDLT